MFSREVTSSQVTRSGIQHAIVWNAAGEAEASYGAVRVVLCNFRLAWAVELSPHRTEHDRPIFRSLLDRLHPRARGFIRNGRIRLLHSGLCMGELKMPKLKTATDSG